MPERRTRTHVFIIDGTLSRLSAGHETNAGLLYKLLDELGPRMDQTVGYDPGIQGEGWGKWLNVAAGQGINLSIEAGYAMLSSRYQPGDRIMLFGYSRGAYAARSLAGFIDRIGLLKQRHATQRRVHRAFRYYEAPELTDSSRQFSDRFCHRDVTIEVLGVWDTVRALGLPYPLLSRLAPMATGFHDHKLGNNVSRAYQALALDETRQAYAPLPWKQQPDWDGVLEQVWFAGAHADVGGHVWRRPAARKLSNIPLRWMLDRVEAAGLVLPDDWQARFPTDPAAPMLGNRKGAARFFVIREHRTAGACGSEREHPSVAHRQDALPRYRPKARWVTQASEQRAVAAQ